jgi:hypothetical protein
MTPTNAVFLMIAAGMAIVASMLWRRALVMGLPFLIVLDGVSVHLAGGSVKIAQVVALALVVPLAASVLIGARRLYTDATTWWLSAILAMNVLSSLLNSPSRAYSISQCASLASVWVIYVLLLNFLDTRAELESFFRSMLAAAVLAAVIGIGAYSLGVLGVDIGGAETSSIAAERLTRAYGAWGTLVEPNLFGSFNGAMLIVAIALVVVAAQRPAEATFPRLMRWVGVSTAIGLLLSFTRAAWLGAAAGALWFAWIAARTIAVRVRPGRLLAPLGVALVLSLVLLLLPGDAGALFRFKLLNLVNVGSQTAVLRLLTYTMALQQSLDHLVIGWGTFSFAPLVAQGGDFQQFDNWRNLWIGNFLLLALHDTGIPGLLLWCGMLWSIVKGGVRATRALMVSDSQLAGRALALTAAVISMLIPFMTTTGFSLGFPWMLIGLLGAHSRLASEAAPAPAEETAPVHVLQPADVP